MILEATGCNSYNRLKKELTTFFLKSRAFKQCVLNRFRLAGFATRTLRVTYKLRSGARAPEIVATQSKLRLQPPPFPKRRGARSE